MKYTAIFIVFIVLFNLNCGDSVTGPRDTGIDTDPDDNPVNVFDPITNPTFFDGEGNGYNTVIIGNQEWTVQNLRTTKYACGTPIPHVTDKFEWGALSTPAYCYHHYINRADSIKHFGALYNWWVVDPENKYNIAPEGWRVPDTTDWNVLRYYLIKNGYNWDESVPEGNPPFEWEYEKIGKALASDGGDWLSSGTDGNVGNGQGNNNSSGFSALPAGHRSYHDYYNLGRASHWWSVTEHDTYPSAYNYRLDYNNEHLRDFVIVKDFGFSIRLVRDVD